MPTSGLSITINTRLSLKVVRPPRMTDSEDNDKVEGLVYMGIRASGTVLFNFISDLHFIPLLSITSWLLLPKMRNRPPTSVPQFNPANRFSRRTKVRCNCTVLNKFVT